MGTFPFGWIHDLDKDNWQIFWNSETNALYVRGAISRREIAIGQSSSWEEAKAFADRLRSEPETYQKLLK
jgi:hypothetical protein